MTYIIRQASHTNLHPPQNVEERTLGLAPDARRVWVPIEVLLNLPHLIVSNTPRVHNILRYVSGTYRKIPDVGRRV